MAKYRSVYQEKVKDMLMEISSEERLSRVQTIRDALTTTSKEVKSMITENPLEANLCKLFNVQLQISVHEASRPIPRKLKPAAARDYLTRASVKLQSTEDDFNSLIEKIQSPLMKDIRQAKTKIQSILDKISGAKFFAKEACTLATALQTTQAAIQATPDEIATIQVQALQNQIEAIQTTPEIQLQAMPGPLDQVIQARAAVDGATQQLTDLAINAETLEINHPIRQAMNTCQNAQMLLDTVHFQTDHKTNLLAQQAAILTYQNNLATSTIFDRTYSMALERKPDWINTHSTLESPWLSAITSIDDEIVIELLEDPNFLYMNSWHPPIPLVLQADLEAQCERRYAKFKEIYSKHQTLTMLHETLYVVTQQLGEITALKQLEEAEHFSAELGVGMLGTSTPLVIYPQ